MAMLLSALPPKELMQNTGCGIGGFPYGFNQWIFASTGRCSEAVLMHVVGMPFVHRGVSIFGIADGDEIERHKAVGDVENRPDGGDALLMRIDAGPDSAESYGVG